MTIGVLSLVDEMGSNSWLCNGADLNCLGTAVPGFLCVYSRSRFHQGRLR